MTRSSATSKGMKVYVGTGTIAAASKAVTVSDSHMTLTANVHVTMTADMTPAVRMWVSGKSGAPVNWYNSSWDHRKKITIDKDKVDATLTNFPVLINLSSDAGLAAGAQADGDDILFTSSDGETKLKHEIEKYTTGTGLLVAWVKIPSLAHDADTEIYMYYGNAGAADQSDAVNVWTQGYKRVFHMEETAGVTLSDSLTVGSLTKKAAAEPNPNTGKIDGAQDFDGANDYAESKTLTNLTDNTAGTIEFWAKIDTDDGAENIAISISNDASATRTEFFVDFDMRTGQDLIGTRITTDGTVHWSAATAVNSLDAYVGSLMHIAIVHDGTDAKIYFNGSSQAITWVTSTDKTKWLKAILTDATTKSDTLILGAIALNGSNVVPFDGTIDEVRITNDAKAATWLSTQYNNHNSPTTFYGVGVEEQNVAEFIVNTDANVTNDSTFDYIIKP